jgi:beta-lactam-binding protein with PASTA domain
MPTKKHLLTLENAVSRQALEDALAPLHLRNLLTFNQLHVISRACSFALPATIIIEQRMPKGTTYVTAGTMKFTVNNRAKLVRENT